MIEKAILSTLLFLLKTLPIVVVTIYLISYLIRKGYMERITLSIQPLLRRFGVSEIAVLSVATCFVSPTASYSLLSQAWREGKVDERGVVAISFLNSFPSVFSHLYSYFIPFVIPVLGFAGIVYTLTRFAVAIVKSLFGFLLLRKWSGNIIEKDVKITTASPSENILRISVIMAASYFVVSLASELGIFNTLADTLSFLPINSNSLAIAVVEFFNIRAAVVVAAGFIDSGMHWKWAVVGLILGNVISFSARAVKHSLPMHVSFFGKFGIKIVALNSLATLILDIFFIVILLLV